MPQSVEAMTGEEFIDDVHLWPLLGSGMAGYFGRGGGIERDARLG